MKAFRNMMFIIDKKIPFWHELGFNLKTTDGRTITIKPLRRTFDHPSGGMMIFFTAEIDLKFKPKRSKDGVVYFPERELKELRQGFRYYSNLISVSELCRVSLSTPTPGMGFIAENEEEQAYLNEAKKIDEHLIAKLAFGGGFLEAIGKDQLLDRSEGLEFMAAANSITDNVGKLHEFVRLFERAFAATSNELADLLFNFLSQYKLFDYDADEIRSWIIEKRDAATHADQRNSFVFSTDLIDDIERIYQAAYDVLFNKASWHDKSTARRDLLRFKTIHKKTSFAIIKEEPKDYIALNDNVFFRADQQDVDFYSTPKKLPGNWWTGIR